MKLYAVYLGDGRYAVMGKLVGTWEFGLNPVVLTTDESYARHMYRQYRDKVNRYNPEGWPKLELHTYETTLVDVVK
jgi:hypothetical protein